MSDDGEECEGEEVRSNIRRSECREGRADPTGLLRGQGQDRWLLLGGEQIAQCAGHVLESIDMMLDISSVLPLDVEVAPISPHGVDHAFDLGETRLNVSDAMVRDNHEMASLSGKREGGGRGKGRLCALGLSEGHSEDGDQFALDEEALAVLVLAVLDEP